MADQGRKGGSAKTDAKARASAENGKKGGRPPYAKLARAIEERGIYVKVEVRKVFRPEIGCYVVEVTGMRADQDWRYDAATNTGGRKFLGQFSELAREYL